MERLGADEDEAADNKEDDDVDDVIIIVEEELVDEASVGLVDVDVSERLGTVDDEISA